MTDLQPGGVSTQGPVNTPGPVPSAGGAGRRGSGRAAGKGRGKGRGNPLVRVRRFFREVVSELRKVIYPGRRELVTYVSVVLVFVSGMIAFVAGLDYVFTKAVFAIFG